MKLRKPNYLIAGIIFLLAGILLIYKNSWGKYIDPWMPLHSKYRGHMSYWVIVAGIAFVLAALLLAMIAFSKDTKTNDAPANSIS